VPGQCRGAGTVSLAPGWGRSVLRVLASAPSPLQRSVVVGDSSNPVIVPLFSPYEFLIAVVQTANKAIGRDTCLNAQAASSTNLVTAGLA